MGLANTSPQRIDRIVRKLVDADGIDEWMIFQDGVEFRITLARDLEGTWLDLSHDGTTPRNDQRARWRLREFWPGGSSRHYPPPSAEEIRAACKDLLVRSVLSL